MKAVPRAMSYDTCARVNALINHAMVTVQCRYPGATNICRVKSIQPSDTVGFLKVKCHDVILGEAEIEVGVDTAFALILER